MAPWASGACVWAFYEVLAVTAFLLENVHLPWAQVGGWPLAESQCRPPAGPAEGCGDTLWVLQAAAAPATLVTGVSHPARGEVWLSRSPQPTVGTDFCRERGGRELGQL